MKQIKTIMKRDSTLEFRNEFDREVNEALADGWTLTKREVLKPYEGGTITWHRMLYAELEREIITEDERDCSNCKYRDVAEYDLPCIECDPDGTGVDKWEHLKG